MKPARFALAIPRVQEEALAILAARGEEAKLLAGGQSLVPLLNLRLARPAVLVDINRLPGLDGIAVEQDMLRIGALTRQRAVERSALVQRSCPLLAAAVGLIGHPTIRNRGTVGGSLAHADPAAELPALLRCLDGELVVRRLDGARQIPASDFFRSVLTTAMRPDEMLTEIRLPLPSPTAGWAFLEVARRLGDFALVGVAALIDLDADQRVREARLALSGVAPVPLRVRAAERGLVGEQPTARQLEEVAAMAAGDLDPDSDIHASTEYRRRVAAVLVRRALDLALARSRERLEAA